jgi:hypothetical protein
MLLLKGKKGDYPVTFLVVDCLKPYLTKCISNNTYIWHN